MDDKEYIDIAYRDQLAETLIAALKLQFPNIKNPSITFDDEKKGKISFDIDDEDSKEEVEKEITEFVNTFRSKEK